MRAFIIRLWRIRLIRFGVWSFAALMVSYALLCAYVNRSGARHWAQVKARIESEGETLDFAKLLPPHIDDSLNFCAIEPLRDLTVPGDEKSAASIKRLALSNTLWKPAYEPNPHQKPGRKGGYRAMDRPPLDEGPAWGLPADTRAWVRYAKNSKYAAMPADSGDAARDLLAGIDALHPLLRELAEAAAARSEAQFISAPRSSSSWSPLATPRYFAVQDACSALTLRAIAACDAGDHVGACHSALALLRFSEAELHDLPYGLFYCTTIQAEAEEAVWTLINKRQATEAELQALQAAESKLNFQTAALLAQRGRLAREVETLDYLKEASPTGTRILLNLSIDNPRPRFASLFRLLFHLVPSGVLDDNKSVFATMIFERCIRPLREGNTQDFLSQHTFFEGIKKARSGPLDLERLYAACVLPQNFMILERTFATEAVRRQALTACALERFYLQHQSYPASLSELTPALLPAVPADPMDDKPLRYRQTSDGRYMLWSIGFDGKDDGGKVNIGSREYPSPWDLYRRTYQGDWTWQYTPVK